MRPLLCLLVLTTTISSINSASILAIFPLHVRSHYVMFERLLMHLADIGHDVDIFTHFPSKEAPPRYKQHSLAGILPDLNNNLSVAMVDGFSHYGIVHFMAKVNGVEVCRAVQRSKPLQDLKKTTKRYDLLITEVFGTDCFLGFGHIFQVPVIGMTSSVALPWSNDRIGNPDNPSYIPNYYSLASAKMSLYEKLENTVLLLTAKHWYNQFAKESNQLSKDFFGASVPDLEELTAKTSLVLINSHLSFSYARPTVPNFIEVGGLHIKEPKSLSPYFNDLLSTSSKGVIFFSLGSMVLSESFDKDKLQGLFDAFAELPYKVLWKATRERFPQGLQIPKNIHFEEWMPQTDILCHPNVKLFVSHGGLMGFQESLYCGVPQLGIPLFADQNHNIHNSQHLGMAVKVAYEDIKKETILDAARKLLEDPSYKRTAERISKEFKDRPMTPLETATFWVEYVVRHKGAPQLRTVGADLALYEYYLLDVVGVVGLGLFFVSYLAIVLVKSVYRLAISSTNKKKGD